MYNERSPEEKRQMVWDDFSAGLISRERADEMLRVIGEHEAEARRERIRLRAGTNQSKVRNGRRRG